MAELVGIRTSQVSPAFLHGNSTSHTWSFSAVAELIDNAYDPDVSASELRIDKRTINKVDCLTFLDNGNGMTYEKLFKMLSFGYCEKVTVENVKPIGYYGNGFKSGSMRLGKDAIVFTRSQKSTSVGFLSQTYLKAINAEAVVVPIVTWDLVNGKMTIKAASEGEKNLEAILKHSPFKRKRDLLAELEDLKKMQTGTNIIIYNLKRDSKEQYYELDFQSNPFDIRDPETAVKDLSTIDRPIFKASPEYRRSLREYCSILYLKPRMKIFIRGEKVKTKLISKSLSQTEVDVYKPTWLSHPVKLTFGFTNNTETNSYGLMLYHKNRLIRAYEKIGCQKQGKGVGVIGVVKADFLEPIHNKQEFNKTNAYHAFMQNVGSKLNDYFNEKTLSSKKTTKNSLKQAPWVWAQCDNCLKWRRLPTGYNKELPEKWYCYLNPDAHFNRCEIPEEPEDEDEALQPTYQKTYKKWRAEKNKSARIEEAKRLIENKNKLKKQLLLREQWKKTCSKTAPKEAVELRKPKSFVFSPVKGCKPRRTDVKGRSTSEQEAQSVFRQCIDPKMGGVETHSSAISSDGYNSQSGARIQYAQKRKSVNSEGSRTPPKVLKVESTSTLSSFGVFGNACGNTTGYLGNGKSPVRGTSRDSDGHTDEAVNKPLDDHHVNSDSSFQSAAAISQKQKVILYIQKLKEKDQALKKMEEKNLQNEEELKKNKTELLNLRALRKLDKEALKKLKKEKEEADEKLNSLKGQGDEKKFLRQLIDEIAGHKAEKSSLQQELIKWKEEATKKERELEKVKQSFEQIKQECNRKTHELGESCSSKRELQVRMLSLLQLIVPDYEYGPPDEIENVIQVFTESMENGSQQS